MTNAKVSEIADLSALRCLECNRTFKNKAGLGSHVARIHNVHLDGSPAAFEGRKRKDTDALRVTIHSGRLTIELSASEDEVRTLLSHHPQELIDSLIG